MSIIFHNTWFSSPYLVLVGLLAKWVILIQMVKSNFIMANIINFSYNNQLRWNGKQFFPREIKCRTKTRILVLFNVVRLLLRKISCWFIICNIISKDSMINKTRFYQVFSYWCHFTARKVNCQNLLEKLDWLYCSTGIWNILNIQIL